MKKLLIIVVLSLWANLVFADSYKILYVNDANLTYKDGRKVQEFRQLNGRHCSRVETM